MDDFDNIDWENSSFKAVVFGITYDDTTLKRATKQLCSLGIGSICITEQKPLYTAKELMEFFRENSVFMFSETEDVCYFGNGYAAIHAVTEGKKKIKFPIDVKCTNIESGLSVITDCLEFECTKHETQIFKIETFWTLYNKLYFKNNNELLCTKYISGFYLQWA